MAGSRKTMRYVSDTGSEHCISADESNVELIMGISVVASAAFPALPKGTTVRFVRVEDVTGLIKRKIPVLTQTRFNELNGATPLTLGLFDPDTGTEVRVRSKNAQKNRFIPRDYDTAKQDGDVT